MSLKIRLGKGIGRLKFGLTETQLAAKLGVPDKVHEMDCTRRLQYFDLKLEFSIEIANENRWGWIEVENPHATLFGKKLLGKKTEKVLAIISTGISETAEYEDYGHMECYSYRAQELHLQFRFGRLTSLHFGFFWNDDGTPCWP
jgi:hypothetical protein